MISSIESSIFQNFPPSAGFSGIYYLQYQGDLKSPPNKLLYHRTDFGKRAPLVVVAEPAGSAPYGAPGDLNNLVELSLNNLAQKQQF